MITLMRYDGTAFPSIPKLSKKIGLSERTVRYALKSLEEKNFISRHPRYTADGARMSNSYTITEDLLDVVGDEKTIGKPVGSDEKNHKSDR